jgi:S-layer homology domain
MIRKAGWTRVDSKGRSAYLPIFLSLGLIVSLTLPTEAQPKGPAGKTGVQTEKAETAEQKKLNLNWTKPYAEALQKKNLAVLNDSLGKTLTRIELTNWLTQAFDLKPVRGKAVPIKDLEKDSPDYWNAQAVVQSGLLTITDGKFDPQSDLTRLEALALMSRALKLEAPAPEITDSSLKLYKDSRDIPKEGRDFVAASAQAGLIVSYPNPDVFGPDDVLTRGEAAVILHQALVYKKELPEITPPIAQKKLDRPKIANIKVSPESTALPGQEVVITAEGSPQAKATFSFAEFVSDQPMTEVSPGVYRGVYVVRQGDDIVNPSVEVSLAKSGGTTRAQKVANLALGDSAPIRSTQNSTPSQNAPDDGGTGLNAPSQDPINEPAPSSPPQAPSSPPQAPSSPPQAPSSPPQAPSSPPQDPGPGILSPRPSTTLPAQRPSNSRGADALRSPKKNTPTRRNTDPDIAPYSSPARGLPFELGPRIAQVGYKPAGRVFFPGDLLEVSVQGDSGSQAYFKIVGFTAEVKMQETAPGYYEGKVRIGERLEVPQGTIQIALEKNGIRSYGRIQEPITIVSGRIP